MSADSEKHLSVSHGCLAPCSEGSPSWGRARLLAGEDVETILLPIRTLPAGLYQQSRIDLAKWLSGFSFLMTIVH